MPPVASRKRLASGAPVRFASGEGRETSALAYRPKSAPHAGPAAERPPLVVMSHGGEQVSFVVDRCEFDLTDASSQVGTVCVRGHHYTPGSV